MSAPRGVLELAQPRPGRHAERLQAILRDIDVRLLLDRVPKARDVMVDEARANAKRRLVMHDIITLFERLVRFSRESRPTRKTRSLTPPVRSRLAHVEHQLVVAVDDVPYVRVQLVLDLRDEIRASVKRQAGFTSEHDAQQMIEPGKVVHVRVRDEHMRYAHQLARRQHADVAQIEQQRAAFVTKIDEHARIAERIVDEMRFKQAAHGASTRRGAAGRAGVTSRYLALARGLFL